MKQARSCIAAVLGLLVLHSISFGQERHQEAASPFAGMRWSGDVVHVQVEAGEAWYGWVAIDGVPARNIVRHAKQRWPDRWRRRVAEDLIDILNELDQITVRNVTLVLRSLEDGSVVTREDVAMSREKRQALRQHRLDSGDPDKNAWWSEDLDGASCLADLQQLSALIDETFSYRNLQMADEEIACAFDEMNAACKDGMSRQDFATMMASFIARFGDGHARVRGVASLRGPFFLPCVFVHDGWNREDRYVAIDPVSGQPLDPDFPFVTAVGDIPIQQWMKGHSAKITNGSAALIRHRALDRAHGVPREHMDGESGGWVLTLCDEGSWRTRTKRVVARSKELQRPRIDEQAYVRVDDDGIVTMRIPSMMIEPDEAQALCAQVATVENPRFLIVDVRGNGGGSRAMLRALMPLCMKADAMPVVVNVGKMRTDDLALVEGALADRYLYPADSDIWSPAAREAIAACKKQFTPMWIPDPGQFGPWHYMVIEPPAKDGPFANLPVIVLQDEGCFSATDIFLGAFAELENGILMGRPSSGGSGRSRGHMLKESELEVVLSTMASFRPDGTLYDTIGIQPDLLIPESLDELCDRNDLTMEIVENLDARRPDRADRVSDFID